MTTAANKETIRRHIAEHGTAAEEIRDQAVWHKAVCLSRSREDMDYYWYEAKYQAYFDALSWILGYQDAESYGFMHDELRDYILDEAEALSERNARIWAAV